VCETGQALKPAVRVPVFDKEVLSLDIAQFPHALHEGSEQGNARGGGPTGELRQPIHLPDLLRAHCKRPRQRSTGQTNDLASTHLQSYCRQREKGCDR
jgi:hypothetical protein